MLSQLLMTDAQTRAGDFPPDTCLDLAKTCFEAMDDIRPGGGGEDIAREWYAYHIAALMIRHAEGDPS